MKHITVFVRHNLKFDMTGFNQILFNIHTIVPKGITRLRFCGLYARSKVFLLINDAHSLSATASGGLRRYLLEHGEPEASLSFRAAVPVNLRPLEEMTQLGNRFGLVFLSLPVGIRDPLERVAELRRRMRALKYSAEPIVTYAILQAMGRAPLLVQRAVVKLLATKTTAVLTSVPGPQQTLYLAGEAIRDFFFWVPQAGRVGLGMSISSYDSRVRLGIATDTGLVPDPARIIAGFHEEFDELAQRVG